MFITNIKCKYKGKCSSEGISCLDCEENRNVKENHYRPKKKDFYIPCEPFGYLPEKYPIITYTDSTCALERFFADPDNKGKVMNLYCSQEAKEELKKLQELNGYADLMILKEKDGSYSIY